MLSLVDKFSHLIRYSLPMNCFPVKRVALFLSLALTVTPQVQAQNPAPAQLRLGIFPNVTHAAGLVGLQKGLIQKELGSTKLIVNEFANGSQVNEAFAAGAIDASYVGPGPAINAFLRGVPIQIYAGAANAGAVLVARSGSGVRNVKALVGQEGGGAHARLYPGHQPAPPAARKRPEGQRRGRHRHGDSD